MKLYHKIVLAIAFLALLGTVTNYVYFSPILTLLVPLCIFVFNKDTLPRPIFWLYVFLGMFLISTVLYDWHSIIEFGFYRRDGNFIISYSPLFVLPLFAIKFDLHRYLRYFYLFALGLYSVLFVYHCLTIPNFSSMRDVIFGGLFIAQNAAGGFLSILGALGFAYYYNRRSKKELCFFLMVFTILLMTYSRGSIIGLVLGIIAWYLAITKRNKMLIATIAVPVLFTIGSVYIGYPYFKGVISTHNEVEQQMSNEIEAKNATALIRVFYTMPRAYYIFLHSPIIGAGVGSYDDRPLEMAEIMPYVSYNAQPQKAHTDRHAHHSYLHLLAEQGIVGLSLFLVFWISLFFYLVQARGRPLMRDYLLIAYFTLTFAAFTEHRLTTPAHVLPFTISLGLFMAQIFDPKKYILKKVQ